MAYKREDRTRHNTIAFWLTDEEKAQVEARIIRSGLNKGEYYRRAILGQEITVIAGNYMSLRVSSALKQISEQLKQGDSEDAKVLEELIRQLLEISQNGNIHLGSEDISDADEQAK